MNKHFDTAAIIKAIRPVDNGLGLETPPALRLNIRNAGKDPGPIPPRGWLVANQLCRRYLSSIVGPGGTGKSALRMLQYIAAATTRPLTGQHVFQRCRVLLLSFEDDDQELDRRIAAALQHHQIDRSELDGWLYIDAPKGLKLAEMRLGSRQAGHLEKLLREAIQEMKFDILGLDPFVKLHGLEENDSGAMDFVCDLLTKLAIEYDIAVDAPHHTRKGLLTPGDADNGRGSGSIRDAARLVYTLAKMSEDEAKVFSISDIDRRDYVRLDHGKVNIVRGAQEATWFRLVSVNIGNGTDLYPNGDDVQTVEPWEPPSAWAGTTSVGLNAILSEIDRGMIDEDGNPTGQRYSNAPAAKDRAVWPVVQRTYPDKPEAQCREIIHAWLASGLLYPADYHDPIKRDTRKGLQVDASKRPT